MLVDEVAAPATLPEAMAFLKRRPGAVPWAGGTLLMTDRGALPGNRPVTVLDVHGLPELGTVSRSDRYLELGACVTLARMLDLPSGVEMAPLRLAASGIGTSSVRDLATIGGNLGSRRAFMSCFPALSCMDAAVELRDAAGVRWSSVHRLVGEDGRPRFPEATLLTRVRVPVGPWDAVVVRPVGPAFFPDPDAATFCAAARISKGALTDVRLAAAGAFLVRDRELEMSLTGKKAPAPRRIAEAAGRSLGDRAVELGAGEEFAGRLAGLACEFLLQCQEAAP